MPPSPPGEGRTTGCGDYLDMVERKGDGVIFEPDHDSICGKHSGS